MTDEDPRAKIKGSRDLLATQRVWVTLGRRLIGNLTTQTTSVLGFVTLLVGLRLIEKHPAQDGVASAFLRFEQLAAYTRLGVLEDDDVLGSREASRRLAAGAATSLSASGRSQILADQRSYGLLGLYVSAARASSLFEAGVSLALTNEARDLVDRHLLCAADRTEHRRLEQVVQGDVDIRARASDERVGALAPVLRAASRPEVRKTLDERLAQCRPFDGIEPLQSQPADGMQARLADAMDRTGFTRPSRADVTTLRDSAREHEPDVGELLDAVLRAESLLVPAGVLFELVRSRAGQSLDAVAKEVDDDWSGLPGFDDGALEAVAVDPGWAELGPRLVDGNRTAALRALIEHHAEVMRPRGSAPWVRVEDGRIQVREPSKLPSLPTADHVATDWHNPYFLGALGTVVHELRA